MERKEGRIHELEKLQRFHSGCTNLVTSSALVIAGLYAAYTPSVGLSLLDAQIITMLNLLITVTAYAASTTIKEKKLGFTFRLASVLHGYLSAAFGIIVYSHPDSFGGAANVYPGRPNSALQFAMLGRAISATNQGLRISGALTFFSLDIAWLVRADRGPFFLWLLRLCIEAVPAFNDQPEEAGDGGDEGFISPPWIVTRFLMSIATMLVLVVMIELTIRWNGLTSTANQLTFGHILPLLMLLDQLAKFTVRWIELSRRSRSTS